ncbi:hypothetical protein ACJMK2_011425 [Sinanodonta woodiana]|uniref:Uncharacterized protein n=1 Tax=Sinanodonta woodiana TaxID=1069815 RepID=A0ABD3V4Y8_SINWO
MYYNTIIAWAVYYTFASFRSEVPWARCNNEWNTNTCVSAVEGFNKSLINNSSTLAASEYYLYSALEIQKSTGIDNLGGVKWSLCLCLLAVFVIVYFSMWKGIQSSGKAVWITATVPYVVLTILLVRGCTLDGALNGIQYYITPKWERLSDPEVWIDAAAQIFFSLGPGFGTLLALSSYNKFHNNCYMYYGGLESVITGVCDAFPHLKKKRELFVFLVMVYCFLGGIPTTTYGGQYLIALFDTHAAPVPLLFICFIEVIAVSWFYGIQNFSNDIEKMLGFQPGLYWKICWVAICPLFLLVLCILSIGAYQGISIGTYKFPFWSEVLGWCITCSSIACIPLYAIYMLINTNGSFKEIRLLVINEPTENKEDSIMTNEDTV